MLTDVNKAFKLIAVFDKSFKENGPTEVYKHIKQECYPLYTEHIDNIIISFVNTVVLYLFLNNQ